MSALPVAEPLLRARPVPLVEPYPARTVYAGPDGDQAAADQPTRDCAGQGVLALGAGLPKRSRTEPGQGPIGEVHSGRQGRTAPGGEDPVRWAHRFVQAAVEVAVGMRPPRQLSGWTTEQVQETLARRGVCAARSGPRSGRQPVVRSLRLSSPRTGVAEVSAVVAHRQRVSAVAFRMEQPAGGWRVTALELG